MEHMEQSVSAVFPRESSKESSIWSSNKL